MMKTLTRVCLGMLAAGILTAGVQAEHMKDVRAEENGLERDESGGFEVIFTETEKKETTGFQQIGDIPSGDGSASDDRETETWDKEYYRQVYADVLNSYLALCAKDAEWENIDDMKTGAVEVINGAEDGKAADTLGYWISDLSGDQIPELVIGAVNEQYMGSGSYRILAVYTCLDGQSRAVFGGWARNRYYLLDDGRIFNEGSNGAIYSIFNTGKLSRDGTKLETEDFYFTYEKNEGNWNDIGRYHNTTGEYDKALSEEMEITEEEFWKLQESLTGRIVTLPLIPLSEME